MKLSNMRWSVIALLQLGGSLALAETTHQCIQVQAHTIATNSATYFKERPTLPGSPEPKSSRESPAPSTNFLALAGSEVPPDTDGSVNADFALAIMNVGASVQTRGGVTITTNSLSGFWTGTNIAPYFEVFDPRVIYDPIGDRWIAVSGTDPHKTNASILIGISRSSSPTNFGDAGWNLHSVKADTNGDYWADQPSVGFNKDWIVVQANMGPAGTNTTGTARSYFWVFNKSSLYAGGFTNYTVLFHADPSPVYYQSHAEIPAITYDNSISTLYILQNANGNNNATGYLRLFSITGSIGSEVLNYATTNTAVYVPARDPWSDWPSGFTWPCGFLPQTNGGSLGTTPDARVSSVVYRNGSLWCAQTIFLSTNTPVTRSAVQWWQIDPHTTNVVQRGRIDDDHAINFYCFPSISVNRFNDVLIGYSGFSTNQFPSANYSFHDAFQDASGDMRKSRVYQRGLAAYNSDDCRWGDYSSTTVDPPNDSDFWTIQEYAVSNYIYTVVIDDIVITNHVGYFGTAWAQVKVDLPPNDNFSASLVVAGMQGSTNGTLVRATRETGEPSHAGNANTPSVWYHWTPPTNGNVAIGVSSGVDSVVAVYTGNTLGGLAPVTDQHGGTAGSQVVFNASSNTTYQIAVAGWNGSYGTFTLSWAEPNAPYFTLQPRGWDVYMGTNVTFTAQAIGAPDLAYQWRFNGTNVSGATNSSYTKSDVQTNDTGDFTVVATNTSGSATSQVAHLEVYSTQKALMTEVSYNTADKYSRFLVSGITGGTYVVEASTNLVNWAAINTNITTFTNLDYAVTNFPYRFYRALYRP